MTIISPNRSPEHTTILCSAPPSEFDNRRRLLWCVNAPPDVPGFYSSIDNLDLILRDAESQWPGVLEKSGVAWLPATLNGLRPIAKYLDAKHGAVPLLEKGMRRCNWLKRHALYTALPCEHDNPELRRRYRLLLAHYFFAHVKLVTEKTYRDNYESYDGADEWPDLHISPYQTGLAVRNLRCDELWAVEILTKLPLDMPLPVFAANVRIEISVTSHDPGGPTILDRIRYIANFCEEVYGIKKRRQSGGSPREADNELPAECEKTDEAESSSLWTTAVGDGDDQNYDLGLLTPWAAEPAIIEHVDPLCLGAVEPATSVYTSDELLSFDDCPDEDAEEGFSWDPGPDEPDDVAGLRTPALLINQNELIREVKMFPFAYRTLSAPELILVEVDCRKRAVELLSRRRVSAASLQEAERCLVLLLMLWTCSSERRAVGLRFITREDQLPQAPLALLLPGKGLPPYFRIRAPFPVYRHSQAPVLETDRHRTDYVLLPDVACLAPMLCRLRELRERARRRVSAAGGNTSAPPGNGRIFPHLSDSYMKEIRTELGGDPWHRLTPAKLASALLYKVISISGKDTVAASMVSGEPLHASKVPMFYGCRQMLGLQNTYCSAVSSLRSEIWREAGSSPPESLTGICSAPFRYVGTRLCPTTGALQDAIRRLSGYLAAPGPLERTQEIVNYHNALTFYTLWYFAFAVGIRAITDPYVALDEISPLNGFALLWDKGREKRRLAWIPPELQDQMRLNASHLTKPGALPKPPLHCYFLDPAGQQQEITPRSMAEFMEPLLPGYPSAIHRRYMFNELLDAGCPPEVVRIWMGHATVGDEPWSRHATSSLLHQRQSLAHYLLPILRNLGFEALKRVF